MSEETTSDSSPPGPGDIIRYARDQRGMTITELADEMRISRGKLQYLEDNQFTEVGADTFVRGYLRASARILKLNADELMAEYEAFAGLGSGAAEVAPVKHAVPSRRLQKWQLCAIVLVSLALLIFVVSLFFSGKDSTAEVQPVPAQAAQSQTDVAGELKPAAPVGVTDLAAASNNDNDPLNDSSVAQVNKSAASLKLLAVANEMAESVSTELSANVNSKLLFTFSGLCWLEVRDSSGRRLYSGSKQSGDSLSLNGQGPFQVRLGNAQSVSLQVNGKDYPIQARSGSKTLKLMVP